ncbi:putative zinc finger protein 467 protein [Phaeoacremonium minimum UCRPA7]|uniref:Putative zinc finger protein 467 protein n=1 Tax=Phaeoacremonium minimum (strain UCR-PA7) TaxID=1286976 RepID=R8BXL8_PHAM7|nr:putative zinc finger protein 467 protein [Phaeoacremonium minimum UCRPA7]EOO04093.1 putative zinc finger protein 467 protein [Phaeoacremonium minimum UCRPA7]
MKRKAADPGLSSPFKKQHADALVSDYPQLPIPTFQDHHPSYYQDHESSNLGDLNVTPVATPTLTPDTALTTISSASRKFPSDEKTIQCTFPNCDKTFNRPARLAAHLRSHTNDRPFKCTFADCDKSYIEEKHLKQHIKGSHTHERQYTCTEEGCGKSFLTATRLRRHAAVHAGANRFRCTGYEGCDQSFRKHQTLQRHIRTDHLGQKAFPCAVDDCGAGFDTSGALRRHTEREHGELRFWCDECTKVGEEEEDGEYQPAVGFTTQAQLEYHIRHEHNDCPFCNKRFSKVSQLEQHMEMFHSGLTVEDRKTVECMAEDCDKKFTRKSNMLMHYRTAHEGLRFVCGQLDTWTSPGLENWNWTEEGCGDGFSSKKSLEIHIHHVHLGKPRPERHGKDDEEPAVALNFIDEISGVVDDVRRNVFCAVDGCPARFTRQYDLALHMQLEHPQPEPNASVALASDAFTQAIGGQVGYADEYNMLGEPGQTPIYADQFWIGADGGADPAGFYTNDEWAREEEEMRKLIDAQPEAEFDPNLFVNGYSS